VSKADTAPSGQALPSFSTRPNGAPTATKPSVYPRSVGIAACGKAILVGEHAVVYGARAVAMPVPTMQMSVKLTPTQNCDHAGAPAIRVFLGGRSVSEHLLGVVHDAFEVLGLHPFPVDIDGHSSVLIGAGLGSSASLCIVILKALAEATGVVLSASELAAAGNRLEKRFHGNPSGLDTAVVACEQIIAFTKGQAPEVLRVTPLVPPQGSRASTGPWRFALLDTGARSSTLSMIQVAAPYFTGADGDRRLAQFDALATAVAQGLADAEPAVVAAAMADAGARLDEAGIVNARIREVRDAALAAGVLAAKPTGAGGGGCVLALLDAATADAQLADLKVRLGATRVFGVELS
jgi:mevalonate kinase